MAEEYQHRAQSADPSETRGRFSGDSRQGVGEGTTAQAVEREDTAANMLLGRNRMSHDPRRYRYDMIRGRAKALPFEVSRDAIMSAEDAGEMLHSIHVKCGLDSANEAELYAFDSGLWFCHTVNGGSVLVPGRSKFGVPGKTNMFDYREVCNMLGTDVRRFFRAYADDITDVNRRVHRDYDPADVHKAEQWAWLEQVAFERGLHRYPWLAHDSADAGTKLTPTERQALHLSKQITIGGTPNAADRLRPSGAVSSADKYDSSVHERY